MVTERPPRLTKHETGPTERQLVLEIRSRRFGYAVLQGNDLLDWGVTSYPSSASGPEVAVRRLTFLVGLYRPSVVLARRTRRARDESSERALRVLKRIRRELKRRSVRFVILTRRDVRVFFAAEGCHSKQDIAALIADRFGELKLRLPRRRRTWEPERHILAVFDSIATAMAFNVDRSVPESKAA